jgi:hypothetical protein
LTPHEDRNELRHDNRCSPSAWNEDLTSDESATAGS